MLTLLIGVFLIWLVLTIIFAILAAIIKFSLKLVFGFPILGAILFLIVICIIF